MTAGPKAKPSAMQVQDLAGTLDLDTLLLLKDKVDTQTFRSLMDLLPGVQERSDVSHGEQAPSAFRSEALPSAALRHFERGNNHSSETRSEHRYDLKGLVEPSEAPEKDLRLQMRRSETPESAPKTPDKVKTYEQAFTHFRADHDAVVAMIMRLNTRRGLDRYTREDLQKELGWSNYKHPLVKVVCDHFQVAMPKGQ